MKDREDKLDKLIKNYEQLHRDLEYRRKNEARVEGAACNNPPATIKNWRTHCPGDQRETKSRKTKELAIPKRKRKQFSKSGRLIEEIYYQPVAKEDKEQRDPGGRFCLNCAAAGQRHSGIHRPQ